LWQYCCNIKHKSRIKPYLHNRSIKWLNFNFPFIFLPSPLNKPAKLQPDPIKNPAPKLRKAIGVQTIAIPILIETGT